MKQSPHIQSVNQNVARFEWNRWEKCLSTFLVPIPLKQSIWRYFSSHSKQRKSICIYASIPLKQYPSIHSVNTLKPYLYLVVVSWILVLVALKPVENKARLYFYILFIWNLFSVHKKYIWKSFLCEVNNIFEKSGFSEESFWNSVSWKWIFLKKRSLSKKLSRKVYIFGENVCRILDTIYFLGRFFKDDGEDSHGILYIK